jgi:hypothetical protein
MAIKPLKPKAVKRTAKEAPMPFAPWNDKAKTRKIKPFDDARLKPKKKKKV